MKRCFYLNSMLIFVLILSSFSNILTAQHCADLTVDDNGASAKIREGGGFSASYTFPCIMQDQYVELAVPFKVFSTVPKGNSDDVVYKMRIDRIGNLPAGMCWVTNKADNVFSKGEGGLLMLRGNTIDNAGQYVLDISLSFDTEGSGQFNRLDVNYNKVSNTGRMILRLSNPSLGCPEIEYEVQSNIAGAGVNTAHKQ